MRATTARQESRFLKARQAYDAAFRALARQVRILQWLADKPDANPEELEEAGCRVERAQRMYRESRDRLAVLMTPGARPAGERVADRADAEQLTF